MLVKLSKHVGPAGETEEARMTVPLKPCNGETVIVEVAMAPARTVILPGLAVTVKSWIV